MISNSNNFDNTAFCMLTGKTCQMRDLAHNFRGI